jgi:hypothetical protein
MIKTMMTQNENLILLYFCRRLKSNIIMRRISVASLIICFLATNIDCTKPVSNKPLNSVNSTTEQDDAKGKAVIYLIKKGTHYCKPNPLRFSSKNTISFTAVFDSSCIYQTVDPSNQNEINKLYGFSDCNSHHLENSARIGWRWSNDSLRIFGFVHYGGEMISQQITTAQIDSVLNCCITCLDTAYEFNVNGNVLLLPRHCSGKYTRYRLYPYFGGDETAPHKIKIQLTEL